MLNTLADSRSQDALTRWHDDHRNFARLLKLIERQVDAFHRGQLPDFELLRSVVYYLRHFPDRCHHPREDIAFKRLAERAPQLQLELARRMQEHVVIASAGEELLRCLDEVIAGSVVARATLERAAATYLVYYRHHLMAEEQHVIPRALHLLSAADWSAVAAIPAEPDPLFGTESQPRFSELRKQVQRELDDE